MNLTQHKMARYTLGRMQKKSVTFQSCAYVQRAGEQHCDRVNEYTTYVSSVSTLTLSCSEEGTYRADEGEAKARLS